MKLSLTLLASYIALTNGAAITVTKTVVVMTQYVTSTVSGTPYTISSELVSTESAVPVPSGIVVESTITAPATLTTSTTSSGPSSSATSSLSSFEAEILKEHNIKRALHGVGDLTWNSTLAKYAAQYADEADFCKVQKLIHSNGTYGENLAAGYVGGAAPVDAWYDEISLYSYSKPGFSEATGHFTQLIWKSTTNLGCAMIACDNIWRQYTICEYSSAGNVINQFEKNVLPLVS
ncbi:PR-1-like protein [Metschnikowia bicuspidata var. bicuspidata NRRL YB-4993]|uniref:PR-1-like protein n=1 Tax=Metschnikowia bicuspidata var. bicuspidata NRRL YB-4993 TaxID=869754 RepID=A0A1A0HHI4_9ASCO|nr:PR-1-like protein [Metschnikowia bicuspidata var. bicuspidata NRRL YB-4993]OBA23308.1 PR-1-like protein [Metschnikowia bicuspidata var. bicuspidata NRRL YB-4993]